MSFTNEETMTVRGTMAKFGFLLVMVLGGAAYTWRLFNIGDMDTMMTFFWIGLIGGLVSALVISFKPTTARFLAPLYGILEGLALGALSVIVNARFAKSNPGIVMQAVGLTFAVALVMFALYNFRIIRATAKFKAVMISATIGIGLFYVVCFLFSLFGAPLSFMSWEDASLLGIGINVFVAAIAALTLIMDFDMIERGQEMGAPKHMEWYGAFGLLVTLVWLYIQILKLLSRLSSSKN
ncbi:hypothetical protein FLA_6060 [Filimonas lacunae]|nr:hypothetical protein FLA_6060 [Filimonas lacunae]